MDIVCIGAAEWHGIYARAQQLMVRLAQKGHRVLYVDPPLTYLAPLKNRALWAARREAPRGVCEIEPSAIWGLKPPTFLPFHAMRRGINRMNQQRLARELRSALDELGWANPVLWTYLPGSCDLLQSTMRWESVVYDCVDDHAAFAGLIDPAVMQAMEDELAGRADIVFASAQALARKMRRVRSEVTVSANAADVEHFRRAYGADPQPADRPTDAPADLPTGYTRRIGFIGGIGSWIDTELLTQVAAACPDSALVMIGPIETDVAPLRALPNVFFLGKKPYALLPDYLRHFQVCLSPFRMNELTAAVNPVKIYEYLAAGKPVVSTALPEVIPFAPVVSVAENADDFVRRVQAALAEDDEAQQQQRMTLAESHSWDARLGQMLDVIEALKTKRSVMAARSGPRG